MKPLMAFGLALVSLVFAASCTRDLQPPEGTEFITVSVGAIDGRADTTLYANDVLKEESTFDATAENPAPRITYTTLEPGTFARARGLLEAEMPGVGEPDFDNCLTTSTITEAITVSTPINGRSTVLMGCGENGYAELSGQLFALLPGG